MSGLVDLPADDLQDPFGEEVHIKRKSNATFIDSDTDDSNLARDLKDSLVLDENKDLNVSSVIESDTAAEEEDRRKRNSSFVEQPLPPEIEETFGRKYSHEDSSHPNWVKHKKHVFALSLAGKPIYSRYGDEQNLAPFMGALTAMVSFVQVMDDNLRYVVAGAHRFAFLVRGSIILVSVSRTDEPTAQITSQLNYIYSQIISILTAGVNQIFSRKPNFDLRSLLGGADRFIDSLNTLMDHDFSFLLNSIHCLKLPPQTRASIAQVLQQAQHTDLLYSIMIAGHQLINLVRPKKYVLQPADLHLVINFVHASTALRNGNENWTPLCLPKFNDTGFLHAYVCFIAPDVCLLLLSTKQECFFELSSCKGMITQGLNVKGAGSLGPNFSLMDDILKAYENPDYSVSELGVPGLLHFVYRSKGTLQYTCPRFETPYNTSKEQKRLYRMYQRVHRRTHGLKLAHKVYYQVSQLETFLGWVTAGFELFAVFGPLDTKSMCIKGCNDILKWIKNEENSIMIINSPVW
ncbi:hypothetical protein PROFUN_09432 [Planoprotostelium fungivorum]|uniref:Vacuolar fusion protein MON1 homolog n=1 Tax=Planoprotostelium fungivorum TaxID=1890364 RepID=A0A2P6NHJ0_9EUKA|nr:hypothetical protein PROFUN_09432 [Planoprotostelium fungivorum]